MGSNKTSIPSFFNVSEINGNSCAIFSGGKWVMSRCTNGTPDFCVSEAQQFCCSDGCAKSTDGARGMKSPHVMRGIDRLGNFALDLESCQEGLEESVA